MLSTVTKIALLLAGEAALTACVTANSGSDMTASAVADAAASEASASQSSDAARDVDWHNCNGSSDPRSCGGIDLHEFDAAHGCFSPEVVHVADLCMVCTLEYASASIGPVCGVDPAGRLFVFTMRPDLRLEAPGWRFGHRRDRGVYKDLEPDLLTAAERAACEQAASLWPDGGFNHVCAAPTDGGDDADALD